MSHAMGSIRVLCPILFHINMQLVREYIGVWGLGAISLNVDQGIEIQPVVDGVVICLKTQDDSVHGIMVLVLMF